MPYLPVAAMLTSRFLFFGICLPLFLGAQDIHFSQLNRLDPALNPALVGVFAEDMRFTGVYRRQWGSVPVPYTTFLGAYDQKYYPRFLGKGYFGLGGLLAYDKQGDSQLTSIQLTLQAAWIQPLNEQQFLSAGFQMGFMQRSFDPDQLTFNNQYNGDVFLPGSPTGELFPRLTSGGMDLAAGLNYHFQWNGSRTAVDIGAGAYHLTRPVFHFYDVGGIPLSLRFPAYAKGMVQIAPRLDIRLHAWMQHQSPYMEITAGGGVRYILSATPGKYYALSVVGSYRMGDAAISAAELEYNHWRMGVSYDWNTSPFEVATRGRGGPELFVQYLIKKVEPLKVFKACPIF